MGLGNRVRVYDIMKTNDLDQKIIIGIPNWTLSDMFDNSDFTTCPVWFTKLTFNSYYSFAAVYRVSIVRFCSIRVSIVRFCSIRVSIVRFCSIRVSIVRFGEYIVRFRSFLLLYSKIVRF